MDTCEGAARQGGCLLGFASLGTGQLDGSGPKGQLSGMRGFGLALGNTRDEALLLNGSGSRVDVVAWGGKARAGVVPFTDFTPPFYSGDSLKRYPPGVDRDDCAQDFHVSYNPSPGYVAGE